jgi:monooxygenase
MQLVGGIEIVVDGKPYDLSEKMIYRGVLLQDLPNFGVVTGYTNASWTLKADLVSEFMCRLINKMDASNTQCVVPEDKECMEHISFMDMSSGYIQRAQDIVPKQGEKVPWRLYQNYIKDMFTLRFSSLNDGVLMFKKAKNPAATQTEEIRKAS